MTKLIRTEVIQSNPSFSVHLLGTDQAYWIVLTDSGVEKFFGFWSQKAYVNFVAVSDVVSELSYRLQGLDVNSSTYREKVDFYPDGWDRWGLGMPGPIFDYLSYEFLDEIETARVGAISET